MLTTHLSIHRSLAGLTLGIGLLSAAILTNLPGAAPTASYIVQGKSLADARAAVEALGGEITHELGVIRAVGARLTPAQHHALDRSDAVRRLYDDRSVQTSNLEYYDYDVYSGLIPDTHYPDQVGARALHAQAINGNGVTVAVLDTGIWRYNPVLDNDLGGRNRLLATYDATVPPDWYSEITYELNGHGTHVSSVIASTQRSSYTDKVHGIAPNVNLVAVRAFDPNGQGTYSDVIRGLDWIVSHKADHNIRLLNISFSAPPSHTTGTTP